MSVNKEIAFPQEISGKYRDSVRGVLLGASKKRDLNESRALHQDFALLPAAEFGNKTLESLGLRVNKEVIITKRVEAQQALATFNEISRNFSSNEIMRAYEMASNQTEPSPAESVTFRALMKALSILLLLGILGFGFTSEAKAESGLPTVTNTPKVTKTPESLLPTPTPDNLLPTTTNTPEAEETANLIPTPTATKEKSLIPTPTDTPQPDSDGTSVKVENEATPELIDYVTINVDTANLRSEPTIGNNIIQTADKGARFVKVEGEDGEVKNADGEVTWYKVYIIQDPKGEKTKTAYISSSVSEISQLPPTPGTGGSVENVEQVGGVGVITDTETVTGTEPITSSENLSSDQELLNGMLHRNFKEFYESKGGTVTWNDTLRMYEVTFLVGTETRTYLALPETSAQKVSADNDLSNDNLDLEHGLYYLDPKGTVSRTVKDKEGKEVKQIFHFVVSPGFPPGTDSNLWEDGFTPTDSKVVIGDKFLENSDETVELFRQLFGFKADEGFELYIAFSDQDMKVFNQNADLLAPRGMKAIFNGGNDFDSAFVDIGNNKYLAVYYAKMDVYGRQYLTDSTDIPRSRPLLGYGYPNAAFERLADNSPFRSRPEQEKFLDSNYLDSFVGNWLDKKYALEEQYSESSVVIDIPDAALDAYTEKLNNSPSN